MRDFVEATQAQRRTTPVQADSDATLARYAASLQLSAAVSIARDDARRLASKTDLVHETRTSHTQYR